MGQGTPFSGGSDHYILADPSVGVPCPMIIQWPDKFYHTSLDTLDKVDPASLHRAGVLAATYAYFLANAAAAQATWLGLEMLARIKGRFIATVQGIVTAAMSKNTGEELAQAIATLTRRVAYDLNRETLALASLRRLSPDLDVTSWQQEAAAFAQAESARGQAAIRAYAASLGLDLTPAPFPDRGGEKARDEWEEKATSLVPVRCYPGPVNLLGFMSRLSVEEREAWRVYSKAHRQENRHLPTVALYWADGQRTLLDIAEAVEMETGQRAVEFLVKYFELLGRLGLVEYG
jgi:hypothetical protein